MRGRFRLRGIKNTPKVLERELLDNSKRLMADPGLIIPKCVGDKCRKCRFAKIEKKLQKVLRYKDDPDKLVKLASKGDPLVRAYAATISLSASGKIPFLSSAQLPIGEISFATRGKVDKEKLIGLQHFDDPDLRLLAYWEMARTYDLHIYSTEKGLFCSATGPQAPDQYVTEVMAALSQGLKNCTCGHEESTALVLDWVSAKKTFRLCMQCADENNLVVDVSGRIAAKDHFDDFKARADVRFICSTKDCDKCKGIASMSDLERSYVHGEVSDRAFLEKAEAIRRKELAKAGGVFVAGEECFGSDKGAFLAAVKGSELEKDVLTKFLQVRPNAIVSDSNQAGKIIAELWPEHSITLLKLASSPETAEELKGREDLTPAQLLAEACRAESCRVIDRSLPIYKKLGEIGTLADGLARAFRTEGREAMVRYAEKSKKDHRSRSVCYAFMMAVGETSKAWQFTKQETDYGQYLVQFARPMLDAVGNDYDDALKNLITAAGANETVA